MVLGIANSVAENCECDSNLKKGMERLFHHPNLGQIQVLRVWLPLPSSGSSWISLALLRSTYGLRFMDPFLPLEELEGDERLRS